MKHIAVALLTALVAALPQSNAEDTLVSDLNWQRLAETGHLKAGTIVKTPNQPDALKIENPGPDPLQATLFTVEQPKITTDFYKIVGEVRYEDVSGDGFLEMWNHFGENEAYFSRTLGEFGPMGKLRGTSDWRPFILPFNATGAKTRPGKLVVNLHLPGKGTVYLRNLKLQQSKTVESAMKQPGAWWSDRTAGLIGGIGGALIGCFGTLIEWLAKRGKSQRFVLYACRALIGAGAVAAGLGLFAITSRQPYSVWYVLLLIGVLSVLIFPFRLRRYQEHYRTLELRRMTAFDAA